MPRTTSTLHRIRRVWDDLLTRPTAAPRRPAGVIPTTQLYPEPKPQPVVGTGTGLFGRYYGTRDLTDVKVAQPDAAVNFDWREGVPVDGVGADNFSVRWTGKVQPRYTGDYRFYTVSDDGVRLFVNGAEVVTNWSEHGPIEDRSPAVPLVAGQKYDIRMEYYEKGGGAVAKLMWSSDDQVKEFIPTSQLYPNTSTVGDFVWLDADGNGRQDAGEPGVAGVKVRILDDTGADAVPAATTTAAGAYSLVVPADKAYRLQFVTDLTVHRFTQAGAWEPDVDSNADATGRTAEFIARPAGETDSNWDAGLRAVVFDLDVNNNGTLTDSVDGAANYLPGYEGGAPILSTASTYNTSVYRHQEMKLIVDGIGSQTPNVTKVVFVLTSVSDHWGYASNRTDYRLEGEGFDKDYSFSVLDDGVMNDQNKQSLTIHPGQMEPARTVVSFWAKDYGGAAVVEARVYVNDGTGERLGGTITLKVPKDEDSDGIADIWEEQMAARWAAQYGTGPYNPLQARDLIVPGGDDELKDPDGAGRLVDQKAKGDGHTVLEEYQGYILDGGGLNGQGANGHSGGHIRLNPARKEVLLEVDRAEVLNNVPGNDLRNVLDGAAKVFSNADRGAGIYMYYLLDEVNLAALPALPVPELERLEKLGDILMRSRDTQVTRDNEDLNLKKDFIHILFVNGGLGTSARTLYSDDWHERRGVIFSTSETDTLYRSSDKGFSNIDEAFMTVTAHEVMHLLINPERVLPLWDTKEHVHGVQYNSELMYYSALPLNRQLSTLEIFDIVQKEIMIDLNEGVNP